MFGEMQNPLRKAMAWQKGNFWESSGFKERLVADRCLGKSQLKVDQDVLGPIVHQRQ